MMLGVPCCILPTDDRCPDCGSNWSRVPHPKFRTSDRICHECGAVPSRYKIRLTHKGVQTDLRYDFRGRPLRTFSDAIQANYQVRQAIADGTYDPRRYRKSKNFDTVADLVETEVVYVFPEPERQYLRDWLAPFLADVGVFVLNRIHFMDFLRTFKPKKEERELAEQVFNRLCMVISDDKEVA